MNAPTWLRPSSLPRLSLCPASGVESEGCVSPDSDAAAQGRAWHHVAKLVITEGVATDVAVREAAGRFGADAALLTEWLPALDSFLATVPDYAIVHCEQRLTLKVAGRTAEGTADLVTVRGSRVEVDDWKTGDPEYADESQWLQLDGYVVAAADEYGCTEASEGLCYTRLGANGWAQRTVSIAEARARVEAVVGVALAQADLEPAQRHYRPGAACTFCPARAKCPARLTDLRAFTALERIEPGLLTADNVGAFDARLRQVEKLVEAAKEARREYVRANGGRVETGDGFALVLKTEQRGAYTVKAGERETLRRVRA